MPNSVSKSDNQSMYDNNLVSFILQQHTENLKKLTDTISNFTVSQTLNNEVLAQHSRAIENQNAVILKVLDELSDIKTDIGKIPKIVQDVEFFKKVGKRALAVWSLAGLVIMTVMPAITEVLIKKYLHL